MNKFKWIIIIALALLVATINWPSATQTDESKTIEPSRLGYSQFLSEVKRSNVAKVIIIGPNLLVIMADGKRLSVRAPNDIWMVSDLLKAGVVIESQAMPDDSDSIWFRILMELLPLLLIFGGLALYSRRGSGGIFSFGKARAVKSDKLGSVTFADVAGCDEAKHEVAELVEFLTNPEKFKKLGGRIPRGVLLSGDPGVGKTLLAKAISGEAKVPFFSMSGSDFVEMFVGLGARRMRELFTNAKKQSPCIVFIDEIDAVGRQRGSGGDGGTDEREQTLNALLVEMDGFDAASGVIVIAATNRPEILDAALLRPGRFDRHVMVSLPDIRGREQILAVHLRRVPARPGLNLNELARGTPGMSGADLSNLVNEAALFAARRNSHVVEMEDFELAKDKIFMGAERKSMVITPAEKLGTAYHEAGHAVIGTLLPGCDPVHKVSVIPRGRALGVTLSLPETDQTSLYRNQILDKICMLLGGRVAEQIFIHDVSAGAMNDFDRATRMASDMVTRYGMSDALGSMTSSGSRNGVFHELSESTKEKVDAEIRRILDEQYARAEKILRDNRAAVELMAQTLVEQETIDAEQVTAICGTGVLLTA